MKVPYASNVVAPYKENPGVPFFMVSGYSPKLLSEESGVIIGFFDQVFGSSVSDLIFNADVSAAFLDRVALFKSRSDGLVDFRSACGAASDEENAGPGYSAPLASHFEYCYQAPKKPNHYAWFTTNLNHFLISVPTEKCANARNSCETRFPEPTQKTMAPYAPFNGLSAHHVMRKLLTSNTMGLNFDPMPVQLKVLKSAEVRGLASESQQ